MVKAHRLVYHSILGLRVIKKDTKEAFRASVTRTSTAFARSASLFVPAVGVGFYRGNVQRFRGGLVFKAHRLVYHSTIGLRVIKKKKKVGHGPPDFWRSMTNRLYKLNNPTFLNTRFSSLE